MWLLSFLMKTTIEISLDDNAIAQIEARIARHKPIPPWNDAGMRKMMTQDRKDLKKVLALYKKGSWKQAAEFSSHLDTAVREMIPEGIWNHIHYEFEQ